jgi:UDP:flavonoid glycosyltransferase YjiC (YdhE family)
MRFFLVAGSNSLSHVVKCLAVRDALLEKGHDAIIAASKKYAEFLGKAAADFRVVPDIQEADDSSLPTVEWFRHPERIEICIRAEAGVIKKLKPDRVIGIFRFTSKAASQIAGVPFDSLICGCMLPDSRETLGFLNGEPGHDIQKENMEQFFGYAGSRMSRALFRLGLEKIRDARSMLTGERTFLWDFPEFMPVAPLPGLFHAGPMTWKGWGGFVGEAGTDTGQKGEKLCVVGFGTCRHPHEAVARIVNILLSMEYKIFVAAGGQADLLKSIPDHPEIVKCLYCRMDNILPYASLVVTHGGQMTIFEALRHGVPLMVLPSHPEQDHNGACLERIGCGKRITPPQPFRGNARVYHDSFSKITDPEIADDMERFLSAPGLKDRLALAGETIKKYGGAETIASFLSEET